MNFATPQDQTAPFTFCRRHKGRLYLFTTMKAVAITVSRSVHFPAWQLGRHNLSDENGLHGTQPPRLPVYSLR